jgi:hypothetical protein
VYKIVCAADPEWCYVGSTFKSLRRRCSEHKSNFRRWEQGDKNLTCTCFPHFAEYGLESHSIELIKEYQVIRTGPNDHKHLDLFETLWIDRVKGCCNKHRPFNPLKKVLSKAKAERLGITQNPALLAMRNERARLFERERLKDPEKRAARNERENKRQKERRAADFEFAEKQRAAARAWHARK